MHIVRSNDIQHTFAHTGKFVLEIRAVSLVRRKGLLWFIVVQPLDLGCKFLRVWSYQIENTLLTVFQLA